MAKRASGFQTCECLLVDCRHHFNPAIKRSVFFPPVNAVILSVIIYRLKKKHEGSHVKP